MPSEISAMAERMADRALVRLAFFFPSEDATVVRDFNMGDIEAGEVPETFQPDKAVGVPGWCAEALRQWEHPQDPVTFSGIVRAGMEVEAWNDVAPPDPEGDREDAVGWVYSEAELSDLKEGS